MSAIESVQEVFFREKYFAPRLDSREMCEKKKLSTLKCYIAAGTGSGRFTEIDLYPDRET